MGLLQLLNELIQHTDRIKSSRQEDNKLDKKMK